MVKKSDNIYLYGMYALLVIIIIFAIAFAFIIQLKDNQDYDSTKQLINENIKLQNIINNIKCLIGTPVGFDSISNLDKQTIMNDINDLKPDYLSTVKSFFFTTNQSYLADLCGNPNLTLNSGSDLINMGCNGGGKIYIWVGNYSGLKDQFDNRNESFKQILCHENLHNLILTNDSNLNERVVDDLAYYGVCYKSSENVTGDYNVSN